MGRATRTAMVKTLSWASFLVGASVTPGCSSSDTVGGACSGASCAADASTDVEPTLVPEAGLDAPGYGDAAADSADAVHDGGAEGSTTTSEPGYPRLGSLLISTDNTAPHAGYDDAYALWASKIHVNVIGANWTNAGAALLGGSREAFVQAIHSKSKIGARVLQYFITDDDKFYWPMTGVGGWLLYQHGTSGPCASDNPGLCNTNQTLYMPADGSGLHLEGEFAKAIVATLISGTTVDAAPSIDGTFHDNTILEPIVAGDYKRDGTQEPLGDPTAGQWIRDGLAEGYKELEARSSLIATGNLGGWGMPTGSVGGGMDASGLAGIVQGGVLEGVFGDIWSAETWSGFAAAKVHYQFGMANTAAPRLVIVHHSKLLANGSDPTGFDASGKPTGYGPPYQALRYGLAFALMDGGYYATTQDSNYFNTGRNWFDEFAVDPTTGVALTYPNVDAGMGYLGQPVDAPWPPPLPNGIYERRFTNASTGASWVVLLNPKGNGPQTVSLGQTMQKLTGQQDPVVNDGSMVSSVVLMDRDGLILKSH